MVEAYRFCRRGQIVFAGGDREMTDEEVGLFFWTLFTAGLVIGVLWLACCMVL